MKTPPPEKPFDPDDPNVDPWADDPNAPKEPGYYGDSDDDIPWSEDDFDGDDDSEEYEFPPAADEEPTPTPAPAPPGALGPAALFDSQLRGEIEFEILFQQTKAEFRSSKPEPRNPARYARWPLALALAAWGGLNHGAAGFAAVVAAMALHELGHLLGQRLFGYRERDLPNFAFPARWLPANPDATAAHRTVTFLLGPLPGLALASVLQATFDPPPDGPLLFFVLVLLGFNLAELWVTNASDGARIFERIPFLRGPWPNVIARAMGVGLLVAAAVALPGIGLRAMLGLLALLVAYGTVRAWRIAKSRQALANIFDDLPERAEAITDGQLRTMLNVVLTLGPDSFDPADLARAMHNLHEQAARPAMARPTAIALFGAYLFGWLLLAGTALHIYAGLEKRGREMAVLLDSFDAVSKADPNDRPGRSKDCFAYWKRAEPAVRREAWRLLEIWLAEPPEKPDQIRDFANALKREAPPGE